ncbi:carbonic anhydrase [Lactifluus volemus]|nr:carbonic anhydrase [Lactifluus volemus]
MDKDDQCSHQWNVAFAQPNSRPTNFATTTTTTLRTMGPGLEKIFSSNSHWLAAMNATEPEFFEQSAKSQSPKILWLGCSDSRVPESLITSSRPGDIFVHRNIANQVHPDDDSVLSVIAYATEVVGVEHILVIGHTNCGGATACLDASTENTSPSEPTTPLARWLAPLTKHVRTLKLEGLSKSEALMKVVEESVRVQVANVINTVPVKATWSAGKKNLWVHGLVYELETGRLRDLGISQGSAEKPMTNRIQSRGARL